MKYLLDTNACVVVLRNRNLRLIQRLQSEQSSDISLCSVVTGELFFGAERSRNPAKSHLDVEAFISPYFSFSYSDVEAREYARIRRDLESRGLRIGDYDMQIAAIAVTHCLTLVTHNTAEFSRIPNLLVEDWEIP